MRINYADWLLRIGLAFAFLYPPVAAWSDPITWLGYVPSYAYVLWPGFLSHFVFLHTFGVVEIILALWLLSGWRIYIPAALMGFLLLLIVAANQSQFEVVFRDLSIAATAFALAYLHRPRTFAP